MNVSIYLLHRSSKDHLILILDLYTKIPKSTVFQLKPVCCIFIDSLQYANSSTSLVSSILSFTPFVQRWYKICSLPCHAGLYNNFFLSFKEITCKLFQGSCTLSAIKFYDFSMTKSCKSMTYYTKNWTKNGKKRTSWQVHILCILIMLIKITL